MDSTFQWELRHPHTESPSDRMPCAREAPGCILVYRDRLYMFGGGTLRYGRSAAQGNKANLGALNDLWRYDPETNGWEMLEPDDGATGFDPNAQRPRTRILPAWVEVADVFYLYGGLSILSKGWRHSHINDLWSYDPGQGRWEMLEPNDGTLLEHPDFTGPGRPATVAG